MLAETLFRAGCLQLLAATSTLSAGVNLNVDVVVIDGIQRCGKRYTTTEYQQMIGRTGRMGQQKQGRVYVMVEKGEVDVFLSTYHHHQQHQYQEQDHQQQHGIRKEGEIFLRSAECIQKALLECVAIRVATTLPDLICLFSRHSLYPYCAGRENGDPAHWKNDRKEVLVLEYVNGKCPSLRLSLHPEWKEEDYPLEYLVGRCVIELIENHFMRMLLPFREEVEEGTPSSALLARVQLVVTELGQAVFRSGMAISEVHSLALTLAKLNQSIDISNSLQLTYHLTPITMNVTVPLPVALDYIETNLSEAELQFIHREILPLNILHQLRSGARMDVCWCL